MLYITSKYIESFVPRLVQFHNQIHLNISLYSSTIVIDYWFAFWIYIRSLHKYYIGAKELRTEFVWYTYPTKSSPHTSIPKYSSRSRVSFWAGAVGQESCWKFRNFITWSLTDEWGNRVNHNFRIVQVFTEAQCALKIEKSSYFLQKAKETSLKTIIIQNISK